MADIQQLRATHYNAVLEDLRLVHAELGIFRVRPDQGPLDFEPGQYTVLGLGTWEPRVEGAQPEPPESAASESLIQRAYSLSCPLLDPAGQLLRANCGPVREFYVTLVRQAAQPPALTPRLFALQPGARLYCGPRVHGHYSLTGVLPDQAVVFAATGTGEAPHNAMLAELLSRGHRGRIVMVTCARYRRDFGYWAEHQRLEHRFANYRYLALTTRELENLDPQTAGYVGKRYLQEYFASGEFERDAGCRLDASATHVFLCGAPDMIGVPRRTHDPAQRYPQPRGMVEVLEGRGFQIDLPHAPGNLHFEKYW